MTGEPSDLRERVQMEVARRLEQIMETPEAWKRFDRDGDGELDDEEWAILRAVLQAEVVHDLDDAPTTAPGTREPSGEWTIADEVEDPSIEMPVLEVIDQRYDVLKEIGHGAQGRTYLARRRDDGRHVALKELSFDEIGSWKELELFQREAAALQSISHPNIPRFYDSFNVEVDGQQRFFLVQDFVSGEPMDTMLARWHRFPEHEVIDFARTMLHTLDYLHQQNPPIVHRDVKPSNIIKTGAGWSLIDFGAVQLISPSSTGGSTVVGTSGYMPPEQFSGRAVPASDLYALGASLIHMLTHIHPSKLTQTRLKLNWRDHARSVGTPLAEFVDRLIEPVVEDRFTDAREALTALDNLGGALIQAKQHARKNQDPTTLDFGRPSHADATIRWEGPDLMVDMSQSMLAPRLIAASLGLIVGITIAIILVDWRWPVALPLVGLALAEAWASGPDEALRITPSGHFLFVHKSKHSRRENSGNVKRLTLDGAKLLIQTDSGAFVSIGSHCSPATRRWVFAKVDGYLKDNPYK